MIVGYGRVSCEDQNMERQLKALSKAECEKLFLEKISGKNTDREKLREMLDFVRAGDTVIVSEFSRLARNTKDLLNITEELEKKGVKFKSIKESIDTSTPTGKLMLTVIGAIAEFEREIILERQREGIAIAKSKGKFQKKSLEVPEDFEHIILKLEYNKKKIADYYGVSRPIVYRWLKDVKGD